MLPSLALGFVALTGQLRFDFYSHGPYDTNVPRPESILRYGPGEHETLYEQQDRVVRAITQAAPIRTKYITFGESVEGRPLRIVVVSSPENMARLESIRGDIATLASGTGKDTEAIVKRTVPIVWINECIHGNEPASFESAMWLLYTLSASQEPAIQSALSKAVVIVNPSYNPDGHERFVDWYNSVATGNPDPAAFEQREPEVVYGRFNHYRFDMNRDRVAMSQPETRQEVAEFLKWTPQVYVDQHGQVTTYFFPPTSMSVNANVDRARYAKWTEIFGRATGKAFDQNGFSYYIKDIFDLYYPGYLDSWSTLSGAIGMTHETDGPKSLARRESDGTILTLKQGIQKHFTSALAVIQSAAANGPDLLRSFADFKQKAASGQHAGKERFVIAKGDPESLEKLQEQLSRSGIQSVISASPINVKKARSAWGRGLEDVSIPAGQTLIVPMAQAQGALAKALFQDATDFEPEFVQEQMRRRKQASSGEEYPQADPAEFYDLTGWGLLYAHDLDGWWVETVPSFSQVLPAIPASKATLLSDPAAIGWGILPSEDGSVLAFHLMQDGVRLQATTREMKIEGHTIPAGTFLALRGRNANTPDEQAAFLPKLQRWMEDFRGEIVPLHTSYPDEGRQGPGSETVSGLRKPSLGVIFGDDSSTTEFGALWYLLERELKLPFTPLHKDALSGDLSRFSAIVFPDGSYDAPSDKLKDWINRGGCAIVFGGSRWALSDKGLFKLDQSKLGKDKTPGSLPGTIFKAELDPRSFLSFGYPHQGDQKIAIAVPVEGSRYYKAKPEGGGAIVFSANATTNKLLSGWEWPDETEKALAGTVWLHDEPTGQGHVVWFSQDPTQRAMWPGLTRLVLNAIVYGPS